MGVRLARQDVGYLRLPSTEPVAYVGLRVATKPQRVHRHDIVIAELSKSCACASAAAVAAEPPTAAFQISVFDVVCLCADG
jgi:hypothetical protein